VSDADPMWQFQERERRLVREIVEFLDAPETNPNRGSVPPRPNPPWQVTRSINSDTSGGGLRPSERVQNCIKAKFPGLYRSVVGAYYRFAPICGCTVRNSWGAALKAARMGSPWRIPTHPQRSDSASGPVSSWRLSI